MINVNDRVLVLNPRGHYNKAGNPMSADEAQIVIVRELADGKIMFNGYVRPCNIKEADVEVQTSARPEGTETVEGGDWVEVKDIGNYRRFDLAGNPVEDGTKLFVERVCLRNREEIIVFLSAEGHFNGFGSMKTFLPLKCVRALTPEVLPVNKGDKVRINKLLFPFTKKDGTPAAVGDIVEVESAEIHTGRKVYTPIVKFRAHESTVEWLPLTHVEKVAVDQYNGIRAGDVVKITTMNDSLKTSLKLGDILKVNSLTYTSRACVLLADPTAGSGFVDIPVEFVKKHTPTPSPIPTPDFQPGDFVRAIGPHFAGSSYLGKTIVIGDVVQVAKVSDDYLHFKPSLPNDTLLHVSPRHAFEKLGENDVRPGDYVKVNPQPHYSAMYKGHQLVANDVIKVSRVRRDNLDRPVIDFLAQKDSNKFNTIPLTSIERCEPTQFKDLDWGGIVYVCDGLPSANRLYYRNCPVQPHDVIEITKLVMDGKTPKVSFSSDFTETKFSEIPVADVVNFEGHRKGYKGIRPGDKVIPLADYPQRMHRGESVRAGDVIEVQRVEYTAAQRMIRFLRDSCGWNTDVLGLDDVRKHTPDSNAETKAEPIAESKPIVTAGINAGDYVVVSGDHPDCLCNGRSLKDGDVVIVTGTESAETALFAVYDSGLGPIQNKIPYRFLKKCDPALFGSLTSYSLVRTRAMFVDKHYSINYRTKPVRRNDVIEITGLRLNGDNPTVIFQRGMYDTILDELPVREVEDISPSRHLFKGIKPGDQVIVTKEPKFVHYKGKQVNKGDIIEVDGVCAFGKENSIRILYNESGPDTGLICIDEVEKYDPKEIRDGDWVRITLLDSKRSLKSRYKGKIVNIGDIVQVSEVRKDRHEIWFESDKNLTMAFNSWDLNSCEKFEMGDPDPFRGIRPGDKVIITNICKDFDYFYKGKKVNIGDTVEVAGIGTRGRNGYIEIENSFYNRTTISLANVAPLPAAGTTTEPTKPSIEDMTPIRKGDRVVVVGDDMWCAMHKDGRSVVKGDILTVVGIKICGGRPAIEIESILLPNSTFVDGIPVNYLPLKGVMLLPPKESKSPERSVAFERIFTKLIRTPRPFVVDVAKKPNPKSFLARLGISNKIFGGGIFRNS